MAFWALDFPAIDAQSTKRYVVNGRHIVLWIEEKKMRSNEEIAEILSEIYDATFSGKKRQRFLIGKEHLRQMYPIGRIEDGRFEDLRKAAEECGIYVFEAGNFDGDKMIGIIKVKTVDRWRRVPSKMARRFAA